MMLVQGKPQQVRFLTVCSQASSVRQGTMVMTQLLLLMPRIIGVVRQRQMVHTPTQLVLQVQAYH